MSKYQNPVLGLTWFLLVAIPLLMLAACDRYQTDLSDEDIKQSDSLSNDNSSGDTSESKAAQSTNGLISLLKNKSMRSHMVSKILKSGANRLCDLQADIIGDNAHNGYIDDDPDDGGWDWEVTPATPQHSVNPSPENTYGVTAFGIWAAYKAGRTNPRVVTCCLDAYLGIEKRAEVNSAPDFSFLIFLDLALHNPGFRELARRKYDAKLAQYGGAQKLAEHIRDARGAASQDGLIPYDLGWLVMAAVALDYAFPQQGYYQHAGIYGTVIADDINNPNGYFNINDPKEPYYVHGISWAMSALSWSGIDHSLVSVLKQKLLDIQLADGSWYWNATYSSSDYQATAYAIINLALVPFGKRKAQQAAQAGSNWLAGRQLDSGGFECWPGVENTEIDGEILLALFLAPPEVEQSHTNETNSKKIAATKVQEHFNSQDPQKPPVAMPLGL